MSTLRNVVDNELFLLYKLDPTRTLGEVCVFLSEDRPGILAAIANVFADHGINILTVSVNIPERSLHFIVDMTNCITPFDKVIEKIRSFSFVRDVEYRVMRGIPIAIPRHIRPTFRNVAVVVLDKALLQELAKEDLQVLSKVMYSMGQLDAKYVKKTAETDMLVEDLLEVLRIVQLRGFCKIDDLRLVSSNEVHVKLSDCIDVDLVMRYLTGLVEELFDNKYAVKLDYNVVGEHAVEVRLRFTYTG